VRASIKYELIEALDSSGPKPFTDALTEVIA